MTATASRTRAVIRALLDAIESRDLDAIEACLDERATWQNVPHAPADGRGQVLAMFERILPLCENVHWEIVSEAYDANRSWLERVDHFVIDGERHSVACNGVFTVDPSREVVVSLRDYVDLGEWRARIEPVYARRAAQSAVVVVERHLDAVRRRDLVAMAADYAPDAVLVRDGVAHEGGRAIRTYFRTVPERLGDAVLTLERPDAALAVRWRITKGDTIVASGIDTYAVVAGRITRQVVELDGQDF